MSVAQQYEMRRDRIETQRVFNPTGSDVLLNKLYELYTSALRSMHASESEEQGGAQLRLLVAFDADGRQTHASAP